MTSRVFLCSRVLYRCATYNRSPPSGLHFLIPSELRQCCQYRRVEPSTRQWWELVVSTEPRTQAYLLEIGWALNKKTILADAQISRGIAKECHKFSYQTCSVQPGYEKGPFSVNSLYYDRILWSLSCNNNLYWKQYQSQNNVEHVESDALRFFSQTYRSENFSSQLFRFFSFFIPKQQQQPSFFYSKILFSVTFSASFCFLFEFLAFWIFCCCCTKLTLF